MGNKLFQNRVSKNFIRRFLSAIIIVPLMILPVIMGGYILIVSYLIILCFVIDELINIIKNSSYKLYSYIYLLITIFSIFTFSILLISSHFKELFIFIILTIWVFDTFSYLGGSAIKGKKIFPNISRGKTYSGLLSGILGVTIIYFMMMNYFDFLHDTSYLLILIVIILSFIGDALVSILKRNASLKDTGNLIPGHGGFLDRLDSFIFVFFIIDIYFLLST